MGWGTSRNLLFMEKICDETGAKFGHPSYKSFRNLAEDQGLKFQV
jgi:hypothetical protein